MRPPASVDQRRAQAARYDVRRTGPYLRMGTASDRYAAWMDQIYSRDVWAGEVTTRKRRLGGRTFEERQLPIASVEEYFEHFGALEIDFTFYRPLVEPSGKSGTNFFVLQQYADHAPPNARFLLKAPQAFAAPTLRQGRGGKVAYVDNPDYLDAEGYSARFYEPATKLLGHKLGGIIFEQAYARVQDSPTPEAFVAEMDRFFRDVPTDVPTHVEVRSPHLIVPPYLAWLADRGLGYVFSHWTWLPPLIDQWRATGERLIPAYDADGVGHALVRLLTPREMSFAESFARAYPFERPTEFANSLEGRRMVDETVALAYRALEEEIELTVIVNNRAWGNAPDLARTLAGRYLDFADREPA